MDWYRYIALLAILSQLLFLLCVYRNHHYALSKYKRKRTVYRPRTVLIVPCKGLDSNFQKNISSLFYQDHENYLLWFVVAEKSDPAYAELCRLKNQLSQNSKAQNVQVFVAGPVRDSKESRNSGQKGRISNGAGQGQSCSQKIHNLLYCYERVGDDVEVLAFADSDVCLRSDWLDHIVYPLRQPKNGAASGYRWFIPQKNNLATLALSAVNAKVAQLLGNSRFNQAWGGSMAIRVETFRRLGLDKIWPKVLSDDLSLSYAVKKAGLKVAFVPACFVASYESTTWPKLFEFSRRQFLITRVSAPKAWWFGLCSSLYSVLGLWAGATLAVYAAVIGEENLRLFAAVPIFFFASQLVSAMLRQTMIGKVLKKDLPKMKAAAVADILLSWLWSLLLLFFILSSAFGRTVSWRGIRYKLLGPTETLVLGSNE
ncbi:MAG: glycosyltransferase family 2 protein [Planctomycetota bacterium]|jgi:cellulose synthase/poly-beta-1,6-N-acetylglucosamine synthase-like glycosyltransferase